MVGGDREATFVENYSVGNAGVKSRKENYHNPLFLLAMVEERLQTPLASTAQIVAAVESTIRAREGLPGRNVSARLVKRLESVAQFHDGLVPLHGRLFAQWLHYAFPYECPYPRTRAEAAKAMLLPSKGHTEEARLEKEKYQARKVLHQDLAGRLRVIYADGIASYA